MPVILTFGFTIANPVLFIILFFALMLSLGTLFLIGGLALIDAKNVRFGSTFVTTLLGSIITIVVLVGMITIVILFGSIITVGFACYGFLVYVYTIKMRHETEWSDAVIAWLLGGLIPLLMVFVFSMVLGIALL